MQLGELLADKEGILGWVIERKADYTTVMRYGKEIYVVEWCDGSTSWQYETDIQEMKQRLRQKQ